MILLKKLIRLLKAQMMIKRMESIDLTEIYAYGTRKDLASKKLKKKRLNVIGQRLLIIDTGY